MIRPSDLPKANGVFLMLTFLAIILGTAAAGYLLSYTGGRVWIGSLVCVGIADGRSDHRNFCSAVADSETELANDSFIVARSTLKSCDSCGTTRNCSSRSWSFRFFGWWE